MGKNLQKFINCSLTNAAPYRHMDEELMAQRGKRRLGFFNQKLNWEAIETKHVL